MCAQRICGLKVSSKHTHCVICTYFGKKGDNCLLFTSGHYFTHKYTFDNYLLLTISYLNMVGQYFLQISSSDKEQLLKIYGREDLFEISPKGTSPTLPPERTQPQKLCTANFSSGILKTHRNKQLGLKKQNSLTTSL